MSAACPSTLRLIARNRPSGDNDELRTDAMSEPAMASSGVPDRSNQTNCAWTGGPVR